MRITVSFAEVGNPYIFRHVCVNMTREQIIDMYELNNPDIAWYKFEE